MWGARSLARLFQRGISPSCARTYSKDVQSDVIIAGAGHNGLVAAVLLGRAGLKVRVLEAKDQVGGAVKTEYPYAKVPGLGQSTGAYLLGVMPPELIAKLGLSIKTLRRDPHYFLPTSNSGYLLLGSDGAAEKRQFESFFSQADWGAHCALLEELAAFREFAAVPMDIAAISIFAQRLYGSQPIIQKTGRTLQNPMSLEGTAERYVRPELRSTFVDLCNMPISHYLERFGFKSDLIKAMYATTDAFSGLNGGWDSPGTGMNFLVHNMCRLEGSSGTWMVAQGGMGSVTQDLAWLAQDAGAQISTKTPVEEVLVDQGVVKGVRLVGGEEVGAKVVLANADPFSLLDLLPHGALPDEFRQNTLDKQMDGLTMKVNLALKKLPEFKCLPGVHGQHKGTVHLLPQDSDVIGALRRAFSSAQQGELPEWPTMEMYFHTPIDPTIQDPDGHHSAALFVQWVPNKPKNSSWGVEEERYVEHLLRIVDEFAPGTSELVADKFCLTPEGIEKHFGIRHGHIHHVDNKWGWDQRFPYQLPISGLYSCSAGCFPAGSVIGAAGHNAAQNILEDMSIRAA